MIREIDVTQLQLGMYIQALHGSWIDHPFWKSSFLLDDRQQLLTILECGIRRVSIDTTRGIDVPVVEAQADATHAEATPAEALLAEAPLVDERANTSDHPTPAPPFSGPAKPLRPAGVHFHDEIRQAAEICQRSRRAVIHMFSDVRMGKAIAVESVQDMVEEISASVSRNPDALITLARLKTADDYTYLHSIAVCALMIALARQLGFDEERVREAGVAGLLHDAGKMLVPSDILNKPGALSDEEFRIIRTHPVEGARVLLESGKLSAPVIDVCLHHHEKMDGTGYPDRLMAGDISVLARMGAICDVYDAVTSVRSYKAPWGPAEAIQRMAQWCGTHFDDRIFQAFVKSVGIYPVGSLVRLESQRIGVVVDQSESSLTVPTVRVFFSARSRMAIPQKVIDLSRPEAEDRIIARESAEKWGFSDLERFWRVA